MTQDVDPRLPCLAPLIARSFLPDRLVQRASNKLTGEIVALKMINTVPKNRVEYGVSTLGTLRCAYAVAVRHEQIRAFSGVVS